MRWWPFRRSRPRRHQRSRHPKGRPYPTADPRLWVRSHGEQRVANFLLRHGIPFEYEPKVCGKRPDFRIRDTRVLVEYWGGAGFTRYQRRMLQKIKTFEAEGWTVVSLFSMHLHELESVLEQELRRYGVSAPKRMD